MQSYGLQIPSIYYKFTFTRICANFVPSITIVLYIYCRTLQYYCCKILDYSKQQCLFTVVYYITISVVCYSGYNSIVHLLQYAIVLLILPYYCTNYSNVYLLQDTEVLFLYYTIASNKALFIICSTPYHFSFSVS